MFRLTVAFFPREVRSHHRNFRDYVRLETSVDKCKQKSNTAPSDEFLACIKRKKEKVAAPKKNKKK